MKIRKVIKRIPVASWHIDRIRDFRKVLEIEIDINTFFIRLQTEALMTNDPDWKLTHEVATLEIAKEFKFKRESDYYDCPIGDFQFGPIKISKLGWSEHPRLCQVLFGKEWGH